MVPRVSVRPLVVHFTEPSVADVHLELVYDAQSVLETVRQLKARIADDAPALAHHRLRLIYYGRVLADGVRLAEWLDTLEARHGEHTHEPTELIHVEPVWVSATEYLLRRACLSEKQRGKQRLPPGWDGSPVAAVRRAIVHLQCSVGPPDAESGPAAQPAAAAAATPPARGFDRLQQTAGLAAADVERMRAEFRASMGLTAHSGDLVRAQDEEEHARALEEQWIDSSGSEALRAPDAPRIALDAVYGLMLGFFCPLVPLLFLTDASVVRRPRPRTDSLEHTVTQLAHLVDNRETRTPENTQHMQRLLQQLAEQLASRAEADGDDDDASLASRIAQLRARSAVFSPYTRTTILLGTLANLVFGIFARM